MIPTVTGGNVSVFSLILRVVIRFAMPHPFRLLLLLGLLTLPDAAQAQYRRVSVGFYNTENLFDTVPSPFYDDREFTPDGEKRWNTERYRCKLTRIARVIDDAGFDLIALAEVENEAVVRDLVATLGDDYCYLHRTSSDSRGIDLALLYKGDKFFPAEVRLLPSGFGREWFYVRGSLIGEEVALLVAHLPSKYNSRERRARAAERLLRTADSLLQAGHKRLIVLGDFNGQLDEPPLRSLFSPCSDGSLAAGQLSDALHSTATRQGTYCWDGRWVAYDHILVSQALLSGDGLRMRRGGIFIRDYLLENPLPGQRNLPRRTFRGSRYLGGYSDHLPVFIVLERQFAHSGENPYIRNP